MLKKTTVLASLGVFALALPAIAQPSTTPPSTTSSSTLQSTTPVMGEMQRASKIIGSKVVNDQGRSLGEVEDIILTGSGQPGVILSVGGFLGMGERLINLPLQDLQWNMQDKHWVLRGVSREQIQNMPAYTYPTNR